MKTIQELDSVVLNKYALLYTIGENLICVCSLSNIRMKFTRGTLQTTNDTIEFIIENKIFFSMPSMETRISQKRDNHWYSRPIEEN